MLLGLQQLTACSHKQGSNIIQSFPTPAGAAVMYKLFNISLQVQRHSKLPCTSNKYVVEITADISVLKYACQYRTVMSIRSLLWELAIHNQVHTTPQYHENPKYKTTNDMLCCTSLYQLVQMYRTKKYCNKTHMNQYIPVLLLFYGHSIAIS
jgi:hypothetical protein